VVVGAAASEAGEPGRRKGNGSDRWTPPVGGQERERRGRWAGGGVGTWAGGPAGLKGGKGERVWGVFLFLFFFSTFSNPFQTLNSFQGLNTSNLLQVFKLF
jgi:hypothetical protein